MTQATLNLKRCFPTQYSEKRPIQKKVLQVIEENGMRNYILELPTGTGKTAIGITALKAMENQGKGPLFYIVPTKTLVEQVHALHPEVRIARGRNAHPCLYYKGLELTADEVPCSLLVDCKHRVDQETGATHEPGAIPCPYLLEKGLAKQGGIVVSTMSFYLFTQLFTKEWETPAALVVDEAHRIAEVVRNALSFDISDHHLAQAIGFLKDIGYPEGARRLRNFLRKMVKIIRKKPVSKPTLLEGEEIHELMQELLAVDKKELEERVRDAFRTQKLDPVAHREVLKRLEVLIRDLGRYYRAFEFALPLDEACRRGPLNYTYAFYKKERREGEKVRYRLVVKAYYVAGLVRKLLSPFTIAYSATIGDPQIFGFETGIRGEFHEYPSDFPAENARIFLPTDAPNLATRFREKRQPTKVLRLVAKACHRFARAGLRSLVVVVSEKERAKFQMLAEEERVKVVSYGNGMAAKDAALAFKNGEGDVLLGTAANYGEGVDLPKETAPVIFFLRPSYPPPDDPQAVFEERKLGRSRWALWMWRAIIQSLQVRGRNVRSPNDLGVTFFISQQFRKFIPGSLPGWLRPAYRGNLAFEACVRETIELLKK